MKYLILAAILVLMFLFFYRVILPVNEPDFKLKGQLSNDKLKLSIRELAASSRLIKRRGKGLSLRLISKNINKAYKMIALKLEKDEEVFEFEKWIYDNHYKFSERIYALKKELNKFNFLPHSGDLPRIYELMQLIVKSCDGYITKELLKELIDVYNNETPLGFNEIKAIEPALNFALLEYIAIFCSKSLNIGRLTIKAKRDAVDEKADLSNIRYNSYVYALYQNSGAKVRHNLSVFCLDNGLDINARIDNFCVMTSHYNGQMRAAVMTLHDIPKILSDDFVITLSPVYELLNMFAGAPFNNVTLATKYDYVYNIFIKSKKQNISELAVARQIIDRSNSENRDISFNILPPPRTKKLSAIYIACSLGLTVVLSLAFAFFIRQFFATIFLISIPISFCVSGIIVRSITKAFSISRRLPSYDIKTLPKESIRTLIAVPRLIGKADEVTDAFKNIETILNANSSDIFSYCMLFDFLPHTEEKDEEKDNVIIERCKELYENSEYKSRLIVALRKRKKINGEEKYQGWEKKRGAIIELNCLILNNDKEGFELLLGKMSKQNYVVTLDSDTLTNCCYQLVELMAHPYNKNTNIISINMTSNAPEDNSTLFSQIFRGGVGLSNYSNYVSDVENDIFGNGNYTGKGIYRVKEFQEKLEHAFKENILLSHDYIEGAYATCQNCGEYGIDYFPDTFSKFITRQLRWLRGDWQLLPFLFGKTKNSKGEKNQNPLAPINKYHIFGNIISSLSYPASLLLLLISLGMNNPLMIMAGVFVLPAIYFLISIRRSILMLSFDFVYEFARQIFYIMSLPVTTAYYTASIVMTIYRLITKKKLLEWKAFAHYSGKVSFVPNLIAAIIFSCSAAVFSKSIFFYILSGLFLLGALTDYIMSKPIVSKIYKSENLDNKLKEILYSTYDFFNVQLIPENNFLPCDNFQEYGEVGWARRTSPTNIGYAVIAQICGYEAGIITKQKLNENCAKIISSVEKLPKWKGNLYNWVDITNFEILRPAYVSTVDSGNFLACLTALLVYADTDLYKRVKKIIDKTEITALLDVNRGLYRIGYNADTGVFDQNHYDLLGSEASLTYLITTSKTGRAPFQNLSRQSLRYGKNRVLCSWTGGMFEHLMSPLFFMYRKGTMFKTSAVGAADSQIRYGRKNKLPVWGISESQYSNFDNNGNYQYKAFGVPQLALSNASDAKIVSPYAGMLALKFRPKECEKNIESLIRMGAAGKYGFYEAVDLNKNDIIKTYMTHHQGMIMASVCNYLFGNAIIKSMQELPSVRAAELLLTQSDSMRAKRKKRANKLYHSETAESLTVSARHKIPYINLLTEGKYSVVTDENGNGYSVFEGALINRYSNRNDGQKIFASVDGKTHNLQSGNFEINPNNSVYTVSNDNFYSSVEILTLPGLSGEVRLVEITNILDKPQKFTIKTIGELVLTERENDIAHPAFSNMFIKTEFDENSKVIYVTRTNSKRPVFLAHYIMTDDENIKNNLSYTTSRTNFYGRSKSSLDFGDVLDPCIASVFSVNIQPKSKVKFGLFTLAANNEESLKNSVKITNVTGFTERIKGNVFALSKMNGISLNTKKIASKIMFGSDSIIRDINFLSGINYKRPTVCIEIKNENSLERLKSRLTQLKKLYPFDIEFNLVLLFSEKHNYYLHLTESINSALDDLSYRRSLNRGSTLNIVNAAENEQMAKRIIYNSIKLDYIDFSEIDENILKQKSKKETGAVKKNADAEMFDVEYKMGFGGFLSDGSYFMDLTKSDTPVPWSNIIANKENFGTIITESGGGYTFSENSQQMRLTERACDEIFDSPSEFVVLSENHNLWSITKKPVKTNSNYSVIHSFGVSEFYNNYNGINSIQKIYIDKDAQTKYYDITLINQTDSVRELDIMFCASPALGDYGKGTSHALEFIERDNIITVSNRNNGRYFLAGCSQKIRSWSKYRESFTDRYGSVTKNESLVNEGSDICLAMSVKVSIAKHSKAKVIFSIGLDTEINYDDCDYILNKAKRYYGGLSKITVENFNEIDTAKVKETTGTDISETPQNNTAIFYYLSKWLPYQVLCSRFFGRTGYYQSGGAIGFRDQLQDCLTILYIEPKLVREHILTSAAHQFEAGDVQHWWHPPQTGVRTNICDDKLFLPLITAEYIAFTKDFEIISERVPYLVDVRILPGEKSVYSSPLLTARSGSLLEHCLKAIYATFDFDQSGLVKMRGGDWNDGMDEVGEDGKGTSVFCTMFLLYVIKKFLPLVTNAEDRLKLINANQSLEKAIENSYDGEWFLRATTDDGIKLGSADSKECKIDIIAQSFAVLSGAADENRCKSALYSIDKKLVDYENGIIKLLDPPFKEMKKIGYISKYPKGVRENGGQYTHGAIWYILSLIKMDQIEKAYELFNMISPVTHSLSVERAKKYRVEPYVIAADVYSGEYAGRGGWSYYTGAASWYYKCFIEGFCGITVSGNKLTIEPNLPKCIKNIPLKIQTEYGAVNITIDNSKKEGDWKVLIGKINYNTSDLILSQSIIGKKITVSRVC